MKKCLYAIVGLLYSLGSYAQESSSAYTVLKLPVSAHASALGGENISAIEDAPWVGWSNPALYSSVSDRSLGLSFMTYASGSSWMGAQFVKGFGERHTAAFSAQYLGYGSMDETDANGQVIGSFSPKDIVVGAGYSYLLSDAWAGGASLKMVTSSYAGYSAFAVAVDLGLNYYDEERALSLSATMRNIGAQVKSFDGRTERVPFCMQVGLTKGMDHAPVRFSLTMTDLTRWKSSDYYHAEGEKMSFGKKFINHFVVGVDVQPSSTLTFSAGYNFRRSSELKAADGAHGAGLTFGGNLNLNRFKLGVSYARYHLSTSSLMFNVAYAL